MIQGKGKERRRIHGTRLIVYVVVIVGALLSASYLTILFSQFHNKAPLLTFKAYREKSNGLILPLYDLQLNSSFYSMNLTDVAVAIMTLSQSTFRAATASQSSIQFLEENGVVVLGCVNSTPTLSALQGATVPQPALTSAVDEFRAAGFNGIFFDNYSYWPLQEYLSALNSTHRERGYAMVNLSTAAAKVPLWFYSVAAEVNATVFFNGSYSSWMNYLADGNTTLVKDRIAQYTNLTAFVSGISPTLPVTNMVNIFHVMKLWYFSLLSEPSVPFFQFEQIEADDYASLEQQGAITPMGWLLPFRVLTAGDPIVEQGTMYFVGTYTPSSQPGNGTLFVFGVNLSYGYVSFTSFPLPVSLNNLRTLHLAVANTDVWIVLSNYTPAQPNSPSGMLTVSAINLQPQHLFSFSYQLTGNASGTPDILVTSGDTGAIYAAWSYIAPNGSIYLNYSAIEFDQLAEWSPFTLSTHVGDNGNAELSQNLSIVDGFLRMKYSWGLNGTGAATHQSYLFISTVNGSVMSNVSAGRLTGIGVESTPFTGRPSSAQYYFLAETNGSYAVEYVYIPSEGLSISASPGIYFTLPSISGISFMGLAGNRVLAGYSSNSSYAAIVGNPATYLWWTVVPGTQSGNGSYGMANLSHPFQLQNSDVLLGSEPSGFQAGGNYISSFVVVDLLNGSVRAQYVENDMSGLCYEPLYEWNSFLVYSWHSAFSYGIAMSSVAF